MLQVVTAQNGSGQNWYRQNGIQRRTGFKSRRGKFPDDLLPYRPSRGKIIKYPKIMKYLFPRKNDCCFTSTLPARRALPKIYASMASPPLVVQTKWYIDKTVLSNIVGTKQYRQNGPILYCVYILIQL